MDQNTVLGEDALLNGGFQNTAIGFNALSSNTTGGNNNTAIGYQALFSNTFGISNTAIGYKALVNNTTGSFNTAVGLFALLLNTTGTENTGVGIDALALNTTGRTNTAVGNGALYNLTTGDRNIAIGFHSGTNLVMGSHNIYIGYGGSIFGNRGNHYESDKIRIGTEGAQTDTFIAGINGTTVPTGVAVIVDASGHLGTMTSSARFKHQIKPMDKTSEAVLTLKPVTFRYKDLDPEGIPQFGLVAEQVEKVNPDLVARDAYGKPYSVRYEAVNAMLLNEFIKEHRKVEEQGAMIAKQEKQIEALTAGLQKVSAQLEASGPAAQTVLNTR